MKQVVAGGDKLVKALKGLESKIANKILRTEIRAATKEVAAEIKELAPVGETGMLRRAVRVRSAKRKKGRIGFQAQIGEGSFRGDTFYGSFVDLGTNKQPAQHFMEDGFKKKADQLKSELPERIWKAIQSEAKGGK